MRIKWPGYSNKLPAFIQDYTKTNPVKFRVFYFKNIFKILLNILFYCLSLNHKTQHMITFNEKMTIDEATKILKFAGKASFPNTDHNRKMIALAVKTHLQKLQGK